MCQGHVTRLILRLVRTVMIVNLRELAYVSHWMLLAKHSVI